MNDLIVIGLGAIGAITTIITLVLLIKEPKHNSEFKAIVFVVAILITGLAAYTQYLCKVPDVTNELYTDAKDLLRNSGLHVKQFIIVRMK